MEENLNSNTNQEIRLIQYPVIQHRLEEMGSRVTERIAALNLENQVATEDTITALKSLRAELNKEAKNFETQRKFVKEAVLNPYNDFEAVYKTEIIEKYKAADEVLKLKINDFEMKIKIKKQQKLKDYFSELVEFNDINWLTFDRLNIDVGLSVSEKKYKEQILSAVDKIIEDLDLIKQETYAAEILVEYKKTLNVSQSISKIRERKLQERNEQERLIIQRTDRRVDALTKLSFVKSDIAKAYYFIHDNTVSISISDIETLTDEEWIKRYVTLEHSATVMLQPKENKTVAPLSSPAVEILKSASTQEQTEEIYEAKFSVKGTLKELTVLKEFLISNNYQYQNLQ
jgi:hypothetical protein